MHAVRVLLYQSTSGVSIRKLSAFAAEDEVVLAPGTELLVVSVEHKEGTAWVTLEEQRNHITSPPETEENVPL